MFSFTRQLAMRWGHKMRYARYRRFVELCSLRPEDTIIDVGAGGGAALAVFNHTNSITAVDIAEWSDVPDRANVRFVKGDGCALPFPDKSFSVAFSNSVIEHIPPKQHDDYANEISRVAERYFVQTPNRWFPIEPHYQLPLFQFVPQSIRRVINARVTLGWEQKGNSAEITLLSARDLRRLFPDADIHKERLFGLTKSLMAVRPTRVESPDDDTDGTRARTP